MKKILAIALAAVMVLSLAACGGSAAPAAEAAAPAAEAAAEAAAPAENVAQEKVEMVAPAEADAEDAVTGPLTEEEAAAARDAGTLVADATTGYDYSDSTKFWYYSNYPNYKDFKADGAVKVAFVCKFGSSWFIPKAETLGQTVEAAGYEYQFIDAASDETAWLDGVQNIINQDYDAVVLTPVNTALLPDALELLNEAGIAYLTTDDPGADAYGFYSPHYGLDDYYLYSELGKSVARVIKEENWLDGLADDYSDLLIVSGDCPSVEAIHMRDIAYKDAIKEAFPEIPDSCFVELDCGAAGGVQEDILNQYGPTIQANKDHIKKWIFYSGTGSSTAPATQLLEENGIDLDNVIISDTCSDISVGSIIENDKGATTYVNLGLAAAPSGVGMGEIIIDLVENGTPIPCFTPYAYIECTKDSVGEFLDTYNLR